MLTIWITLDKSLGCKRLTYFHRKQALNLPTDRIWSTNTSIVYLDQQISIAHWLNHKHLALALVGSDEVGRKAPLALFS
jgi:hypothetical protein